MYEQLSSGARGLNFRLIFIYVFSCMDAPKALTRLSSYTGLPEPWQFIQGLHRLEKYLNIQDSFEKSLKIKFALKRT